MIGLGISFAIVPQTLYGSIPKVVDSDVVGTAMGINFAFHSFGKSANSPAKKHFY